MHFISAINDSRPVFFTVPEVSKMLNVNRKTVYKLLDRGLLQASSAIRHKRIHAASVEQFIQATVYNRGGK
jgi:excisionase family DNA binding protein